ncbi:hypothetical protein TNIN_392641 [Trichonephila inaurata madagascariensis]|uniref:Uncharacterized protein n=1 Tax=Trichonephila inaurata madagascariensis TaxID=2747483 RepID=A0A8X6JAH7_9ARAC|nr:hypothetical protein TNIN_392641 [Trichonephila inaurata madagascariensis]
MEKIEFPPYLETPYFLFCESIHKGRASKRMRRDQRIRESPSKREMKSKYVISTHKAILQANKSTPLPNADIKANGKRKRWLLAHAHVFHGNQLLHCENGRRGQKRSHIT